MNRIRICLSVASRGCRPMRPTWLPPLLACACAPGSGEDPLDFTLRLRPLTPLNQPDLFDDVDRFTITSNAGVGWSRCMNSEDLAAMEP